MQLIKWDTVCLPTCKGGLGIKKTKIMNQALLAKVRWQLHLNENGLWGNMLKHKYLKEDSLVTFGKYKTSDSSSTWRGIMYGAKLVHDSVKWRIGDGCIVDFWVADWVPNIGRLLNHVTIPLSSTQVDEKVVDYMSKDDWDIQKLRTMRCHIGSGDSYGSSEFLLRYRNFSGFYFMVNSSLMSIAQREALPWIPHVLFQNLCCNTMIMGSFPAYLLFFVTLWHIWKWRCKCVFDMKFKLPECASKIIFKVIEDWLKANEDSGTKSEM
ncbi:hypothetical protein QYF36_007235 [Acer negundo]|nr:hypothetical protein QYF36_007235 [Acer negundo]